MRQSASSSQQVCGTPLPIFPPWSSPLPFDAADSFTAVQLVLPLSASPTSPAALLLLHLSLLLTFCCRMTTACVDKMCPSLLYLHHQMPLSLCLSTAMTFESAFQTSPLFFFCQQGTDVFAFMCSKGNLGLRDV